MNKIMEYGTTHITGLYLFAPTGRGYEKPQSALCDFFELVDKNIEKHINKKNKIAYNRKVGKILLED